MVLLLATLCAACFVPAARAQTQWESEIQAYEAADLASPPPRGSVVVTGSSTIRLWTTMTADLAPLDVIPRGFGGSIADDLDYYLERVVLVYQPRAVVIYEGENDIAGSQTPQYVADRMAGILARISARLPSARVYVISVKPSPSRWSLWSLMGQANSLLAAICAGDARYTFINASNALLGNDGLPRPEYYQSDQLHLNAAGYVAWTAAIRPVLHAQQLVPLPADTVPPTAPTALTATAVSASRVDLRWSAAADSGTGLAGYRIYRDGALLVTTTATTYSDNSVAASTSYVYTVTAIDRAAAAANESLPSAAASATTFVPGAFVLRINAAGPAFTDASGGAWSADTGFNTGTTATYASSTPIYATANPILYRTERWDAGTAPELQYALTVPNGSYEVRLHFAENYPGAFGVGRRVFSVQVEGSLALQNLDIYAAAGANTSLVRKLTTTVNDGQLNIVFLHGTENPLVNGIEVIGLGAPPDTQAPGAPGAVTATALDASQVTLSWTAATDNVGVTGYDLERCTGGGCTNFALVATVTGIAVTNTGLAAATTYRYRVRARDAAGNLGAYSAIASVTTQAAAPDTQPPGAPGALSATPLDTSQVALAWGAATDNVGVTGYDLERCTGTGCTAFAVITTTPGVALTNTGLASGTTYQYRVRARDAAGNAGPYTAVAVATTATPPPPDTQSPTAPGTLTATAAGTAQINLSWAAATDNVAVTGYDLERCAGAGCTGYAAIGTVTGLSYSNTGLAAGTTYQYRVRARDAAGNTGPYGASAAATTAATPPFVLRVNAGGSAYTDIAGNAWSADTGFNTGSAASYPASMAVAGTSDPTLFRSERWDGPNTPELQYAFTVPNGSYQVRLYFAENYSGNFAVGRRVFSVQAEGVTVIQNLDVFAAVGGNAALVRNFTTSVADGQLNIAFVHGVEDPLVNAIEIVAQSLAPDTQAPGAPGTPGSTAVTYSQVSLTWGAATDNVGVASYELERCSGAGCANFAALASVAGTSYADITVSPSTVYQYRVRARDAAGNAGPYGGVAALTTPAAPVPDTQPPAAPASLAATAVDPLRVDLAWPAASDNVGVVAYELERCSGAACSAFSALATVTGLSYTNSGLVASTTYRYRVRARDAAGNVGSYSPIATTTTPATPPFTLRINTGGGAYTDAAGNIWNADSGFNTGSTATYSASTAIAGTSDAALYRTERWDDGSAPELQYSFTVPNGNYQVRLHFAENYPGCFGVGRRVFSVQAEGATVVQNLDVYATVGANAALVRSFTTTVGDGQLNLVFVHATENPLVDAIEVIAQP